MTPDGERNYALVRRIESLSSLAEDLTRHVEELRVQPLRIAARRLGEAPDADLRKALGELPESQRQRLISVLLRIPVGVTP